MGAHLGGEGHAWAIALDATATEILAAGRYEGTVDFDGQTVTAEQDRAFVRGYSLDGEPLFTHLVEGGGSFAGGVAVQDGVAAAVGAFSTRRISTSARARTSGPRPASTPAGSSVSPLRTSESAPTTGAAPPVRPSAGPRGRVLPSVSSALSST
jgi:hypothetical protein